MTDHPDLARLLAGILADPASDGARLAWADRLAELGDGDKAAQERAEFVRVQCQLAGLGECRRDFSRGLSCRCRFCAGGGLALRRRERDLWNAPLVLRELPDASAVELSLSIDPGDVLTRGGIQGLVRRGSVESVTMPSDALAHLDAVRACQPVTRVTLNEVPGMTLVARSEGMACYRLSSLSVRAPEWFRAVPGDGAIPAYRRRLVKRRRKEGTASYVARELLAIAFPGIAWTLPPGKASTQAAPRGCAGP